MQTVSSAPTLFFAGRTKNSNTPRPSDENQSSAPPPSSMQDAFTRSAPHPLMSVFNEAALQQLETLMKQHKGSKNAAALAEAIRRSVFQDPLHVFLIQLQQENKKNDEVFLVLRPYAHPKLSTTLQEFSDYYARKALLPTDCLILSPKKQTIICTNNSCW